jgi:nucleoside-diphosphate-sugar epimerase
MSKVIITGGNGFLGSHIVRLFLSRGVRVTCFVRRGADLSALQELDVELKYGDVRDPEALIAAFKGHDFVIHNAGYVKDWGEYKTFYETNVQGSLNVLSACKANAINDVIITGTNSVYGEENSLEIKNEKSPYNSHYRYFLDKIFPCKLNYYRDTKCIAVQKAEEFARRESLNVTILEPVWVYGENGKDTVFIEYLKLAKDGFLVAPGSSTNKFHVIYAGDLAEAYYLAFQKRLKGVHRIIIGNPDSEYMDKIFGLFCKFADVKKPALLPKWVAYPPALVLESLFTIFNAKNPPVLTRGRVNMFYDNIEYSPRLAEEILGFKSRYSLDEGIRNTVNWYKEQIG